MKISLAVLVWALVCPASVHAQTMSSPLAKELFLGRGIIPFRIQVDSTDTACGEISLGANGWDVTLVRNGTKNFYSHTGNASVNHEWHTPLELLERLYGVFGEFDLDPCSPTRRKSTAPVRAKMRYMAEDDGLGLPWFGTTFLNPPYGRTLGQWTMKVKEDVAIG